MIKWNPNYSPHFITGVIGIVFGTLIIIRGRAGGIVLYRADGFEAYLRGVGVLLIGVFLFLIPFFGKRVGGITKMDVVILCISVITVEFVSSLIVILSR